MSLYNDLNEVLTPYANKIKELNERLDTQEEIVERLNEGGLDIKDEVIETQITEQITDWLDDHPEATTTVQDGSLTYKKFVTGTLGFVTPEMFGAKGDGITDDTEAWQSAVDSGYPVQAEKKVYKCGQINVTRNIIIDCKMAEFICVSNMLFNIYGSVTNTLENESDYSADSANYQIVTEGYETYSGYGMLCGTNNWNTFRTTYLGGMVGFFRNGVYTERIPVDVTGISVLLINPITCDIKNISGCEFTNTHDGKMIVCTYGVNCVFENINVDKEVFTIVGLARCYKCVCRNIFASLPMYTGESVFTYPIALSETCFSAVIDSYIYNPKWHAITTGGDYISLRNIIDRCEMYSDGAHAIEDHECGIGTMVINSRANGINLAQGGYIDNVVMVSRNDDNKISIINFTPSTIKKLAKYTAKNITFCKSGEVERKNFGIRFFAFAKTSENTAYLNDVLLENIINQDYVVGDYYDMIQLEQSNNSGLVSLVLGDFVIDNTNMRCSISYDTATMYDTTNAKVCYRNCRTKRKVTGDPYITITPSKGMDMFIENSVIAYLASVETKNLTISNVEFVSMPTFNVTQILRGSNMRFDTGTSFDKMTNTNVVALSNVVTGQNNKYIYDRIWRAGNQYNVYAEELKNNGTSEITALVDVSAT